MPRPRRKKFTSNGHRSGFEDRICKWLEDNGIKFYYEPFSVPYEQPVRRYFCSECGAKSIVKKRDYTPDIVFPNKAWVEIKGRFSGEDRTKMLAIKAFYPDQEIYLLFMADNYLTKKKATKYSEWAERHGFEWHVDPTGKMPFSWAE